MVNSNEENKRKKIIDAIYPQKLVIEKGEYRTPKANEGNNFILLNNIELY